MALQTEVGPASLAEIKSIQEATRKVITDFMCAVLPEYGIVVDRETGEYQLGPQWQVPDDLCIVNPFEAFLYAKNLATSQCVDTIGTAIITHLWRLQKTIHELTDDEWRAFLADMLARQRTTTYNRDESRPG